MKYVLKKWPIPPVRSAYALVKTPSPCTYVRMYAICLMYNKLNTELRSSTDPTHPLRNPYASADPPGIQCVRSGLDPPPFPLCAYVLYE